MLCNQRLWIIVGEEKNLSNTLKIWIRRKLRQKKNGGESKGRMWAPAFLSFEKMASEWSYLIEVVQRQAQDPAVVRQARAAAGVKMVRVVDLLARGA